MSARGKLGRVALALGAAIAPGFVGLALAMMAARGPHAGAWIALVAATIVALAAIAVAIRARRSLGFAAAPSITLVAVFLASHCGSPIPPAPRFDGALPDAHPPEGMTIARIETGIVHRSAAFGFRGGSMFEARDFAMNAVLVRHPKGDVLLDTGLGEDIDTQIQAFPALFRWMTSYERTRSTAAQLEAAGYDRASLHAILLTHAHWDHASGLGELSRWGLADVPVLVPVEERRFIDEGGDVMAVTRSIGGVRWQTFAFEGPPYLGFPSSFDVHGDGAIVAVPTPGHTPGSIIVFVTLPTPGPAGPGGEKGARYAFVGDLVWQLEGITERADRPWLTRRLADADPASVRDHIAHVAALHDAFPELVIVPAHDARAYASLPPL